MGLAGGEPALKAVPSVDASYEVPTTLPETLPETGGEMLNTGLMIAIGAGLALIAGGLLLRKRAAEIPVEK
jgi:LPXTG-motif cell wall-anchored protein